MMLKKITGLAVFGMLLGVLAFGSGASAACTPGAGQPAALKQIVTAVADGATISFYDADGNLLWSSAEGAVPDATIMSQVAKVVITDANGEVLKELAIAADHQGEPVITVDGHKVGLGMLLKEAGIALPGGNYGTDHGGAGHQGKCDQAGAGNQNHQQNKHELRHEHGHGSRDHGQGRQDGEDSSGSQHGGCQHHRNGK